MPRTSSSAPAGEGAARRLVRGRGRSSGVYRPAARRVPAFDTGVRLLSRRPYAGAELSRRLMDYGYEEDEVRAALKTFAELGYVDDAEFAASLVRRRSARRGPRALAAELAAKGVDREVASQAIERYDREAQLRAAMRLVRRAPGSSSAASYEQLLDSVGPKLLRRGFSHAIAWAACRAVWSGTADPLDA